MNPLLQDWTTAFEMPPFAEIHDEHFAEAFDVAFENARKNVNTIAENEDGPNFKNTIEALELSSELLSRVSGVFHNLVGADSNPDREALQRDISPRYASLHSETMMNEKLFSRIEAIVDDQSGLNDEQKRVLHLYHRMFVRAGAKLKGNDRDRFKQVMQRLAELGTNFSQNVLAEERNWTLPLTEDDVEGLPQFLIDALESTAKSREQTGYLLALTPSLIGPFLQFSPRRDLREKVYKAWKSRGINGGAHDTRETIKEILELRAERANLLGFEDFASFKLAEEMAKTPQNVKDLLEAVWEPAKSRVIKDASALTEIMQKDGINDVLKPHDWHYYAEKRKQAEHNLNEAELKPYLQLDNMIEAAFDCANRLFGLEFKELQMPLYHDDARVWEVTRSGDHVGLFVGDYFARSSKRSGAWCSRFRPQSAISVPVSPIVVNVCNFSKAKPGSPTLCSFEEARTLFHEFGHALHTLLSNVTYPFISGTSVARDFVELPSQLYEHWLSVPEVLTKHALHTETGAPISPEMVERVLAAENADQGFATVSYVASAIVDIDFHSGAAPADPIKAQQATLDRLGIPPEVDLRHAAPHFQHVFSGDGYSSGYYSYMWSEVMDADAFAAFEETGDVFDRETAQKLEKFVYSAGGSEDPATLYTKFRGSMPKVDALLEQRGLAS